MTIAAFTHADLVALLEGHQTAHLAVDRESVTDATEDGPFESLDLEWHLRNPTPD
uniref:Uncharacterized protein n=1 Tax=uncultured prokaryote TaxID=198431 RepID=A0A0H5Q718_9ZZZZ|nr:hypothetical protein [uncultured prokaryote]